LKKYLGGRGERASPPQLIFQRAKASRLDCIKAAIYTRRKFGSGGVLWMKKALIIALFVVMALSSVALAATPIKIGYLANLTGDAATWGVHEKNGAILAIEEINKKGGVQSSPRTAVNSDPVTDSPLRPQVETCLPAVSLRPFPSVPVPPLLPGFPPFPCTDVRISTPR
jgi:ABC-type branched-subunit amino acid transport system substrate-binding protein